MNFYEGVSREIYEKESHQNQMNNKPSTYKTNTETSIFQTMGTSCLEMGWAKIPLIQYQSLFCAKYLCV